MTYRWYIRCKDCLSVSMIELDTKRLHDATQHLKSHRCICDGQLEPMGYVEERTIVTREGEECACDERCTSALGPICSCRCGGKNHGHGMAATVHIKDISGIPTVTPPVDAAKVALKAREYREAVAAALARIELSKEYPAYADKLAGRWVNYFSDYLKVRDWKRELHAAHHCRTHSGRLKKLAAIAA